MIRHPSSVIVAAPSGSGETVLVEQLLREKSIFQVPPKKVVYAYDRWQPRFDRMKQRDGIQFYKGIPDPSQLSKWFSKGGVLVLDDLMEEGGQDKRILDLFTKDSQHHRPVFDARFVSPRQVFQDHQPKCSLHYRLQKSLR